MSDHTANGAMGGGGASAHPVRVPRAEFRAYFTVIFLLALPVGLVTWTLALLRTRAVPRLGPFARAWYDAKAITPMIFSA
jgi:PufQ cytochrome subunit